MKDIVILVMLEEEHPRDSLKNFHVEYTDVGKINTCFKAIEVINKFITHFSKYGKYRLDLNLET